MSDGDIILTYSEYFLGSLQRGLFSNKNTNIGNACTKGTYAKKTYARGTCIRDVCANSIDTIKHLKIHLQSSQISEVKLFGKS